MPNHEVLTPDGLTPDEIALLELTSPAWTNSWQSRLPQPQVPYPDDVLFLSTKEAYRWGPFLRVLLEQRPSRPPPRIFTWTREAFSQAASGMDFDDVEAPEQQHAIQFRTIASSLAEEANLSIEEMLDESEGEMNTAYEGLRSKHLIEDPAILTTCGLAIAVLGVLPFNFTQRTRKGELVYRRISAPLWNYEFTREDDEIERVFNLRVLKAVKAFKRGAAEAWDEAIEEE